MVMLRWILLLPGVVVAWFLVGFLVGLMALVMEFEGLGPIRFLVSPQMLDSLLRDLLVPGMTVWYGSHIAPSHRLQVAAMILITYVLLLGWAFGAIGGPNNFGQVAAGFADITLSIASAVCGLYFVYKDQRQNSLAIATG